MPDLFDWVPPLQTEPRAHKGVTTSEIAAKSMRKCSGPMQIRIVGYLAKRGVLGATYDEVVRDLDMEKPTVAGRLNDLSRGGFIKHFDVVRPTRSGRPAKVYWLTEAGKDLARQQENK